MMDPANFKKKEQTKDKSPFQRKRFAAPAAQTGYGCPAGVPASAPASKTIPTSDVTASALPDETLLTAGRYDEVLAALSHSLCADNHELAAICLAFYTDHPGLLSENELLSLVLPPDEYEDGEARLLGSDGIYSLQLTRSSVLNSVLLTSDRILAMNGIVPAGILSSLSDAPHHFIPDEASGEKCVLLHAVSLRGGSFTAKAVKKSIGRSCPLYYECSFRRRASCGLRASDAADILEKLEQKGVIAQAGAAGIYRIQSPCL